MYPFMIVFQAQPVPFYQMQFCCSHVHTHMLSGAHIHAHTRPKHNNISYMTEPQNMKMVKILTKLVYKNVIIPNFTELVNELFRAQNLS